MKTADSETTASPRKRRGAGWGAVRRTLPDAWELVRPQMKLWTIGLGLMLINRLAGLVLPGAPKFLIDEAIPQQDSRLFTIIIVAVLVATLIQGLTNFALTQTISKAAQRLIARLRIKLHHHVTRLPTRYFDNRRAGEIVSRVMDDVEGVRNLLGTGMVELLGGVMTACLVMVILFWLNWLMTLAIIVCMALFLIVLVKAFQVLRPLYKKRQEARADLSGRLTESLNGIRVVKAYTMEEAERGIFGRGVDRILTHILGTIHAISYIALTSSILLGVLGATVLFIGGRQLMAGTFTAGEFVSYVLYLGFMIAPLSSILMVGANMGEVFAGLERIREVLDEEPEDAEEKDREPLPALTGHIRFEEVSFEYEKGIRVLHDVTFDAPPGTVTAIAGPSGSGKSTLIGLAASFYHPVSGRILVDGQDLAKIRSHDYRRHLGVVLQENFLFDGTIAENIVYARPDASEEAMREAARLAHCEEFIDRFPEGYDTVIGERGVKLSGGQRQRLAIARALLADPRILILDEATSALDSESEAAIQEGLSHLMAGRTVFVIAHRLSTIRNATRILVLEDGRIVESGTHDELLAKEGRYYEMYTRQHGIAENLFLLPGEAPMEEDARDGDAAPARDEAAERRKRAERLSRLLSGE